MKRGKSKEPRQYSIVRFNFESPPKMFHRKYPFKRKNLYVFFGEIANMPSHCVVADYKTGKVFSGYHTENFTELDEDET